MELYSRTDRNSVLGCKIFLRKSGLCHTQATSGDKAYTIVRYSPNFDALGEECFWIVNDKGVAQVLTAEQFNFAHTYSFNEEHLAQAIRVIENLFWKYSIKCVISTKRNPQYKGRALKCDFGGYVIYYTPWMLNHIVMASFSPNPQVRHNEGINIARQATRGLLSKLIRKESGDYDKAIF